MMFFTIVIIINQCYIAKYIDFKDESVSTSENGQTHYKKDKMPAPKLSIIGKFHCIIML